MKNKVLVLAYPGTGKTYLADHYKNVSDFEFQHYRYDYGEYKDLPLEQLKGRTDIRTIKPEWPDNFFKFLNEEIREREIILIPFATSLLEILDYLESSQEIRIIFAIHNKDSFETLAENFKKKGNSEEFIERRKNDFQKCHDIITKSKFEKVYIEDDEGDREIVAAVVGEPTETMFDVGESEIQDLVIRPEYESEELAADLIGSMVEYYRENGAKQVHVWCVADRYESGDLNLKCKVATENLVLSLKVLRGFRSGRVRRL